MAGDLGVSSTQRVREARRAYRKRVAAARARARHRAGGRVTYRVAPDSRGRFAILMSEAEEFDWIARWLDGMAREQHGDDGTAWAGTVARAAVRLRSVRRAMKHAHAELAARVTLLVASLAVREIEAHEQAARLATLDTSTRTRPPRPAPVWLRSLTRVVLTAAPPSAAAASTPAL